MNVKWNNKRQFSTSTSATVQIFRPEQSMIGDKLYSVEPTEDRAGVFMCS